LTALKGGYESMSTEFSKMAVKVKDPLITIKNPISIQEEITNKLPILAVDDSSSSSSDNTSSDNTTNDDTSSDNTSSDNISSNNTKKIIF
jgi:hypothetical protein